MEPDISSFASDSVEQHPFRFFDLPSELRYRIFQAFLLQDRTLDLSPENHDTAADRLNLFLTSRQVHDEAYPIFYGGHTFRIFPTHPRFYGSKVRSILVRLSPRYRAAIHSLELRLGPGWSKPPRTWTASERLRLRECTSVQNMIVFVECDPSHQIFRGFRVSKEFFTEFSADLLGALIDRLPALDRITFDRYPAVKREGELMTRLQHVVEEKGKRIFWARGKWDVNPFRMKDQVNQTLRSDLLCAIEAIMSPRRG